MFSPVSMGVNSMLGIDNSVPLTTNNFEVRIYDMNGEQSDFSQFLTLSTDQVGAIREEQNEIIVHYGNGIIKFPSKVTYANVDWTLNCFCEPNVLEKLRVWRKLVFDSETEKMGLPSQYMKQVFFIKYDGQGNVRDVIRCPGTWINGLDSGEHNQEGGSVVKVKVQFVISKAIYETADTIARALTSQRRNAYTTV